MWSALAASRGTPVNLMEEVPTETIDRRSAPLQQSAEHKHSWVVDLRPGLSPRAVMKEEMMSPTSLSTSSEVYDANVGLPSVLRQTWPQHGNAPGSRATRRESAPSTWPAAAGGDSTLDFQQLPVPRTGAQRSEEQLKNVSSTNSLHNLRGSHAKLHKSPDEAPQPGDADGTTENVRAIDDQSQSHESDVMDLWGVPSEASAPAQDDPSSGHCGLRSFSGSGSSGSRHPRVSKIVDLSALAHSP